MSRQRAPKGGGYREWLPGEAASPSLNPAQGEASRRGCLGDSARLPAPKARPLGGLSTKRKRNTSQRGEGRFRPGIVVRQGAEGCLTSHSLDLSPVALSPTLRKPSSDLFVYGHCPVGMSDGGKRIWSVSCRAYVFRPGVIWPSDEAHMRDERGHRTRVARLKGRAFSRVRCGSPRGDEVGVFASGSRVRVYRRQTPRV